MAVHVALPQRPRPSIPHPLPLPEHSHPYPLPPRPPRYCQNTADRKVMIDLSIFAEVSNEKGDLEKAEKYYKEALAMGTVSPPA